MRETFRAISTILLWGICVLGPLWFITEGLTGWTGLPGDLFSSAYWSWSEGMGHAAFMLPIIAAALIANLIVAKAWAPRWARIVLGLIYLAFCLMHVVILMGHPTDEANIGHFLFVLAMAGLLGFFSLALLREWPARAVEAEALVYQRIDSLDLLRGIAILGIFLMNTWTMSLPQDAYTNPATYNPSYVPESGFPLHAGHPAKAGESVDGYAGLQPPTGGEYATFLGIHLFADTKFITMFSMMFGAGILLQGERAAARGLSPWRIHYGRMTVLLGIGLIHAFGIWYGDILTTYSLLGMVLFPLRKLPIGWLALVGALLIASSTFMGLNTSLRWHIEPIDKMDEISGTLWNRAHLNPSKPETATIDQDDIAGVETELHVYGKGGTWLMELRHRAWESFRAMTFCFPEDDGARCAGSILIGMALMRLQFFRGKWPRGSYAALAAIFIPVGWVITYLGVVFMDHIGWVEYNFGTSDRLISVWGLGAEFNYWGSLITEFGYISFGVMLAFWAADPAKWVLKKCLAPIRSIGRMALSCYILESLIGTTLFYGHGFGLFGTLWRTQLLIVVGCAWAFLLVFAPIWLMFFKQGPLEWVWHRIVYWRGEPPPLRDPAVAAV